MMNAPPAWTLWLMLLPVAVGLGGVILLLLFPSRPNSHGAARWARSGEVKSFYKSAGPVLGRDGKGKLLRASGDAPLITIAPPRSGKGAGQIIPTLLLEKCSMIVIDPKGEAARATASHREKFGPVHIIDPFGSTGQVSARYNPLSALCASATMVEDAFEMAEAIVPADEGDNRHYSEGARDLIRSIILHICVSYPDGERHLLTLRRILNSGEGLRQTLNEMSLSSLDAINGPARQQLAREAKEASGMLSTAGRNTGWLDSVVVSSSLEKSDFCFADLKNETATVFFVVPPTKIESFARWLRLITICVNSDFERDPLPRKGCLFVIDEAAALGRLKALETAYTVMPGYGLRAWSFWQNIHQLKANGADSLLSASGTQIYSDVADLDTAKLVSGNLGDETVLIGQKPNIQRVSRQLLAPELVRQERRLIIFERGKLAVRAHKIRWWEDKQMAGLGHNERS
ncbi:type IV secretory system conjugative DNA transfer family protein [Castellaniella sp.]|uniref:type IV secretory system conjugative DNA transfer family protein n=1 Tax=Castellaniella sp. TaxID=1955812 RepID=UPI002AFE11D5|nr:type IV secretory system conjugative DNA transfer family protein [Castellaniella sp.]